MMKSAAATEIKAGGWEGKGWKESNGVQMLWHEINDWLIYIKTSLVEEGKLREKTECFLNLAVQIPM